MENGNTEVRKVIVFQLQNAEYAISVKQVVSIERVEPITRIPQTADFVKGVVNMRGVVTPIIDLRTRFGLEETNYGEATRTIIIHMNDIEVGLIVDAANDVIDVPEHKLVPAPKVVGTVDADYIEAVAKLDDRLIVLLDLPKVLTQYEVDELKSVEG